MEKVSLFSLKCSYKLFNITAYNFLLSVSMPLKSRLQYVQFTSRVRFSSDVISSSLTTPTLKSHTPNRNGVFRTFKLPLFHKISRPVFKNVVCVSKWNFFFAFKGNKITFR